MRIARIAVQQRPAVLLATVMLAGAGLLAMFRLPAGIYPETEFNRIVVIASGGTFEPRDMVVAVTRPLEEALIGTIGLRRLRSRTVRGGSELNLDFRPGADMPFALQQVQGRIAELTPTLPFDVTIQAERLTPSVFPILQFQLRGGDPVLLRDLAQYTIRPRFAAIADVGKVEVQGGLVREVSVQLDPGKLAAQGVALTDVADRIKDANQVTSAGRLDREYRQFSVLVSGLAASAERIGDFVVKGGARPVRVRDLGRVGYGVEDRFQLAAGNGEVAALINVSRQPTGNILDVESSVLAVADSIRRSLPAGVRLESVYDLGGLVRDSIKSVRDAILIGGLLAAVVLVIFLGRLELALAAAVAVPLTILGTFGGLALFGDSLNLMSLGGIAVAVGLIIDDAVVVVENLERRLGAGGADPAGVEEGVAEIVAPVVSSTLTTVVVFAPLGLLEGVVGGFFRSFSLALTIAVLLSLGFALGLIPALSEWALRRGRGAGKSRGISVAPLIGWYGSVAQRVVRRPWTAGLGGLALVVLALVSWRQIETGFLPEMDEGGFILDYWAPTGTALAETDRQLHQLERLLRADSAVAGFSRRTGAELGLFATAPNRGDLTVLLRPRSERSTSVYEVMDRIRRQIEGRLPDLRVEFHQVQADLLGDLTGAPEPVELKVFHPDVRTAIQAAGRIAGRLDSIPGLVDLFNGDQGDVPELVLDLDPPRVARLGLTEAAVAAQARGSMFGADGGNIREADRLVPIRVRLPDAERLAPDALRRIPILGSAGWAPLGTLGVAVDSGTASELLRENLRPLVTVTGGVDPRVAGLGSVMAAIRRRLVEAPLPAGSTLEYGGQEASQRRSFQQLLVVFALATSAVLFVMVIHFQSVAAALVILVASLLGASGALVALAVTGTPFNVSSFMGLILLVGLVVKNGIILFDAARVQAATGTAPIEALLTAGRLRLRPILMTTICTLAGLLPLAFGLGAGAELQRPLAIAVIGGLSLSTVVTLLLLPAFLLRSGALGSSLSERR